MLLFLFLLLVFGWYINYRLKHARVYKLASEFDGPPTIPLLGNALKCFVPQNEIPRTMINGAGNYKSPIRIWLGPYLFICLWNPNDIKTIYNSPHSFNKPHYFYRMAEAVVGESLVSLPVGEWKRHRRLISSSFSQDNLIQFCSIFGHHANVMVRHLQVELNKGSFDVCKYITECTFNLILDAILNFKSENGHVGNVLGMQHLVEDLLQGMMARFSNVFYAPDFIFSRSPVGKKFKKTTEIYRNYIDSLIKKWKEKVAKEAMEMDIAAAASPRNLVEHLLLTADDMGKLTIEELNSEVNLLIIAGFETLQSTLGFVLITLGMHPEIQEAVYQEILLVLGTKTEVSLEDLGKLTLLDRVIKESMRVFPAITATARMCDQDVKLANHTVPKKTPVVVSILNLHRDPSVWPNPSTFDPDRFLPEEEAKRHPYSWIPFSGGPRNCIGHKFAFIALKIMAIHLLLNYKIATPYKNVDDVRLTMYLVLKPTDGFKISISAR